MATRSSIFAWEVPWTEVLGGLPSMGLQSIWHDLVIKQQNDRTSQVVLVVKNSPANSKRRKRHKFDPWVRKNPRRRAWQPTPVFLPGESHGQSVVCSAVAGCSP